MLILTAPAAALVVCAAFAADFSSLRSKAGDYDKASRDAEIKKLLFEKRGDAPLDLSKPEDILLQSDLYLGTEQFQQTIDTLKNLKQFDPPPAEYYWRTARAYFLLGEYTDLEKQKERLRYYGAQIKASKACLDKYPQTPECRFFYAVGKGRRATTMGLVRAFLGGYFKPKEFVDDVWKVIDLRPTFRVPTGQSNTLGDAYIALSVFYRQAPSGFIARMVMGVEGDREKSVLVAKKAVELESANVVYHKELGLALLCQGYENDNAALMKQGRDALKETLSLRARTWLDRLDQEHSRIFVEDEAMAPKACRYNRDGFQDPAAEWKSRNQEKK